MIEALEASPLAARPEDHAFLAALVEEALADTSARLAEAGGPLLGVILGGSLARGEGTVWRGEGGPRALSDIDLAAVVMDEAARVRALDVAPFVARGVARRLGARGLAGGFDLGVYTPETLARQGPRPGTLEYRRSGRVLQGAHDLASRFPALVERDVPSEEALVLLENRGAELLLAWPGAIGADDVDGALQSLYAGMKAQLDGAFALVVAHGQCPATTQARQAALESWTVEGRSDALRAVLPDFESNIQFWSAMKLTPDPVAIAFRLGVPDAGDLVALARRAWREGARAWVAYYRAVAGRVLGGAPTRGTGLLPLAVLASHAAHRAHLARRLRRWWETGRTFDALERDGRAGWALRPRAERPALALQGAPEHELASCVAVLLGAWSDPGGAADWRGVMQRRFPGACPERLEWEPCRRAVVRLWDTMHMGGTRTAWDVGEPAPGAAPDPAARPFTEQS